MTRIAFNAPAMLARILALRHANTHLGKPIGMALFRGVAM